MRTEHDVRLWELDLSSGSVSVSLPVRPSFLFFFSSLSFFHPRFCFTRSAFNYRPDTPSAACFLSNVTTGSFLCGEGAHAGLLPVRVHCGTRLFGPPSSSSSSLLLLLLLLPPLGCVQMAEAGGPDLGGVLAEQNVSPALERAYRSRDLRTPASLLPAPALPLSQLRPRETEVQLVPEVQMAA